MVRKRDKTKNGEEKKRETKVEMVVEDESALVHEVSTARVLSFQLWRDSIASFDAEEIEKLRGAEQTLQRRATELELQPSASTRLTEEEREALLMLETVIDKKIKGKDGRKQTMVEASIDPGKKGQPKSKEQPPKLPARDQEEDEALPPAFESVSLLNLKKGHVADKTKNFDDPKGTPAYGKKII